MGVKEKVGVTELVGISVMVAVSVSVNVAVRVSVLVGVPLGDSVIEGVCVGLGVGVNVDVGVEANLRMDITAGPITQPAEKHNMDKRLTSAIQSNGFLVPTGDCPSCFLGWVSCTGRDLLELNSGAMDVAGAGLRRRPTISSAIPATSPSMMDNSKYVTSSSLIN